MVDVLLPEGYLRRPEVMTELEISSATLERMTRDERLHSRLIPVPGRKSERVYLTEDVERHKLSKEKRRMLNESNERQQQQRLLTNGSGHALPLVSVKTGPGWTVDNLRELVKEFANLQSTRVPFAEKLWLSWSEASEISGIPQAYVRKAAKEEKIVAKRFGRAWRVLRSSLEKFTG